MKKEEEIKIEKYYKEVNPVTNKTSFYQSGILAKIFGSGTFVV